MSAPRPCDAAAADFDTHDPHLTADPYPTYAGLRTAGPVVWCRAWGGY